MESFIIKEESAFFKKTKAVLVQNYGSNQFFYKDLLEIKNCLLGATFEQKF